MAKAPARALSDNLIVPPSYVFRPGDHLGVVFETDEEKYDFAAGYLLDGLARDMFCLYIYEGESEQQAIEALAQRGVEIEKELAAGELRLIPHYKAYLEKDRFRGDAIFEHYDRIFRELGYDGQKRVRAIGELDWITGESINRDAFFRYEARLNSWLKPMKADVACLYRHELFGQYDLIRVVQTHTHIVYDRIVYKNHFYIPLPIEEAHEVRPFERFLSALYKKEREIQNRRELDELSEKLLKNEVVGIYTVIDGRFDYVNQTFLELLELTADEAAALDSVFEMIAEDQREEVRQRYTQRMQGVPVPSLYELHIVSKTGKSRTLINNVTLTSIGGKPAALGIAIDVTQKQQLEEQLQQAQKMESIGSLAGGIAHDFNNILGGIMGYALIILNRSERGDKRWYYADKIIKSSAKVSALNSQLLGFARKSDTTFSAFDFHGVINDTVNLLKHSIDKRIAIDTAMPDYLPRCFGDEVQVQQVLLNLAINSCDAMPDGGKLTIKVETGTYQQLIQRFIGLEEREYVLIRVSDTGHGIPTDVQERVFDPFFTTKEKGLGTGLGLATAYRIIRDHSGSIKIENTSDKGTTFAFVIPVAGDLADNPD